MDDKMIQLREEMRLFSLIFTYSCTCTILDCIRIVFLPLPSSQCFSGVKIDVEILNQRWLIKYASISVKWPGLSNLKGIKYFDIFLATVSEIGDLSCTTFCLVFPWTPLTCSIGAPSLIYHMLY